MVTHVENIGHLDGDEVLVRLPAGCACFGWNNRMTAVAGATRLFPQGTQVQPVHGSGHDVKTDRKHRQLVTNRWRNEISNMRSE